MRSFAMATAALVAAAPLLAQGRLVDEGTFVITRAGTPAGRESFRIAEMPSGTGEVYRATAQVALGERHLSPSLTADTLGAPVSYDIGVRDGAATTARLQARTRPGRFSVVLQTAHGESAKEYAIPARSIVLEDDVFHQYYFLGRLGPGTVTVLFPLSGTDAVASVARRGSEPIEIGGRPVTATRYSLVIPGHPARDFWLDSSGRLLRVAIPEHGLLAQRDELPR